MTVLSWIRTRSVARAAVRTRDRPQAATDVPAAADASLEVGRGRAAQGRQQRGLRCDIGASRTGSHAVKRARPDNERPRRRGDRNGDERAETRWAMRVGRVAGSRRRSARVRPRAALRREHAVARLNVRARRRRAVVAPIGGRASRRIGADRREQMHRQDDERDCEAAAALHCGDSTPLLIGKPPARTVLVPPPIIVLLFPQPISAGMETGLRSRPRPTRNSSLRAATLQFEGIESC
jgi:hypothetical protein